jgi:hypothetical protein
LAQFESIAVELDADADLRESIREAAKGLESVSRRLQSKLQAIHAANAQVKQVVAECKAMFDGDVRAAMQVLKEKVSLFKTHLSSSSFVFFF